MTEDERRARACEWQRRYRIEHPEAVRANQKRCMKRPQSIEKARLRNRRYRQRNLEMVTLKNTKWRSRSRPAIQEHHLKVSYGISAAEYARLLAFQDGRCAICRSDKPRGRYNRFGVDHEHESGRVRGLLCFRCNAAVGLLGDDPVRTERAAAYLKREVP